MLSRIKENNNELSRAFSSCDKVATIHLEEYAVFAYPLSGKAEELGVSILRDNRDRDSFPANRSCAFGLMVPRLRSPP